MLPHSIDYSCLCLSYERCFMLLHHSESSTYNKQLSNLRHSFISQQTTVYIEKCTNLPHYNHGFGPHFL